MESPNKHNSSARKNVIMNRKKTWIKGLSFHMAVVAWFHNDVDVL